jgi:hypothetical protein
MARDTATTDDRRLRSLGGAPPPPGLEDDLRLVSSFPPAALAALWSVLGPCLTEPIPREMNRRLDDFARVHGVDGDALARGVRGCRSLVRSAALLDLPAASLVEDAMALAGDDAPVAALLLRGYDAAKAQIRAVAITAALGDHGRVLDGIDWRLDQVVASSAGGLLRFPVAVMTLRCRSGGREERITVQASPERLRELQILCDTLLGRPR